MKQALTTAFGGWAKSKAAPPRAQARAARHRPPRVAGRFAGLGADLFLARQRRRGQALQRPPGARPGEHAVRRALHLHPQHRAAHQVRTLVRRRVALHARHACRASSRSARSRRPRPPRRRSISRSRRSSTLKRDALAPEMLESARAYVLGQYPLQLETAAHWAATLADLEFYGLGKDYIEGYAPALAKVDLGRNRGGDRRCVPASRGPRHRADRRCGEDPRGRREVRHRSPR